MADLRKITLTTGGFEDVDPNTGAGLGTFRRGLVSLDKELRGLENVIKSASNTFQYFNESLKRVDPKTGLAQQSFYINPSETQNVLSAIKQFNSNISNRKANAGNFDYTVDKADIYSTTRTIYGTRAQRKAIEDINNIGGVASVSASNKDALEIKIPVQSGTATEDSSKYLASVLKQAMKYSSEEKDIRKQEDKERQEKEDRKREAKEGAESKRRTHSLLLGVVGALTLISNLIRRLVTASFAQVTADTARARQAHDLGLTAQTARQYAYAEARHGLAEGTILGGVQTFQNAFGNITSLDENMIRQLAFVLGEGVANDVRSGLPSGKRPSDLMQEALNAALTRYEAGQDYLGNKMSSKSEARRSLVSWAGTIDENFASVLSQMIEDKEKGMFKFSDFSSWLEATAMGGKASSPLTNETENYITSFNVVLDEAQANLKSMAEVIKTNVLSSLESLVVKVANIDFGKSAKAKLETDAERRAFLKSALVDAEIVNAKARGNISSVLGISEADLNLKNLSNEQMRKIASAGLVDEYLRARKAEDTIKRYGKQLASTNPIKDFNPLDFDFASNIKDMTDLATKFYLTGKAGNWDLSGTLETALKSSDYSKLTSFEKDIFTYAADKFIKSMDAKDVSDILKNQGSSAFAKTFAKALGYKDVKSLLGATGGGNITSIKNNPKYQEALYKALSAEYGFGITGSAKNAIVASVNELSQKEAFEAQAKDFLQLSMTEDVAKQIVADKSTSDLRYAFTPSDDHKFLTLKLVGKDSKVYYSKSFEWDSDKNFEGETGAIDWADIFSAD